MMNRRLPDRQRTFQPEKTGIRKAPEALDRTTFGGALPGLWAGALTGKK